MSCQELQAIQQEINALRKRIETVYCQLSTTQQQAYFELFGETHHGLEEAWFRLDAVLEKIQAEECESK